MPKLPVRKFRLTDNASFLNAIRTEASSDYQRRVPEATKANMAEQFDKIWNYLPNRNEFLEGFINKIGRTVAHRIAFDNPLSVFKKGFLEGGDTVEEYANGLIDAYTYDPSRDYLERDVFGQARPEVKVAYHKLNRSDSYKVTINETVMKRAFTNASSGLYDLINDLMATPQISDQWDEFLLMSRLMREYYDAGGFFKVQVPDITDLDATEADARRVLKTIRATIPKLQFVSTHYNAAHMPVAVPREKLVLIINPDAQANLDVEGLAPIFHLDKAEIMERVVVIPEEHFAIPGGQAILTTEDFFMVFDIARETEYIRNPAGRYTNYWLHVDQIISASPFVPTILFTIEAGDEIENEDPVIVSVPALEAYERGAEGEPVGTSVTEAARGDYTQITGYAVTDPANGVNGQLIFNVVGDVPLATETYVDNNGTLYVSPYELSTQLTITGRSAVDPTKVSPALVLTVTGEVAVRDGLSETVEDAPEGDEGDEEP